MAGMWFVVCVPKDEEIAKPKQQQPQQTLQAANGAVRKDVNGHQETRTSAKQALQDCLEELGVDDAVWCSRSSDKVYQVMFPCESGEDTDLVLKSLNSRGIGLDTGSTVGVVPCAIFYQGGDEATAENHEEEASGFKNAQQKFLKSVTARLTVAQVVEGVRSNGELNFDYVAFIILAGMIAALGLMDNSVVSIIAAMLVSPLMGPIAAITFGIIIRDKSLVKVGLRTELCGLLLCLVFGFVFGLIMAYWGDIQGPGGWGPNTWPNSEQTARGQWRSLWVGALVALPSGAGVAMAILGGNSACLVGVAISASLLPPSINCGSLWALSLMKVFKSLGQDPINIKEIAPESSMPRTQRFWKHDIKVARDYNRTLHESDLGQEFLQEWAKVSGVDPKLMSSSDPQSRLAQLQTLQDILMDAEDDDVYQTVTRHLGNQPASLARRLTMAALPGGGLQPCADPADPESGLRWRRNSQLVSNMLHNFERRSSKNLGVYAYDNPSPVRDALSPPSSAMPGQPHQLSRRRSSVQQRSTYWPSRFSVSPVAEPRRRMSRASVRPAILREEEDETSRI
ncbi:uncharacterized protein LOC119466483 isoform X2 [Dermacentor silvarum]|uniref:uncharacterized protein LOC119466483 isoform X2 n=1 Tax=Dermacentor silvarum TaxID=543639 RepID=UPI0021011B2F|nr:uncharacterized protein LOC119466483 isoform X2 [Dermacentor silvarum]